jgi:hypothetical protein
MATACLSIMVNVYHMKFMCTQSVSLQQGIRDGVGILHVPCKLAWRDVCNFPEFVLVHLYDASGSLQATSQYLMQLNCCTGALVRKGPMGNNCEAWTCILAGYCSSGKSTFLTHMCGMLAGTMPMKEDPFDLPVAHHYLECRFHWLCSLEDSPKYCSPIELFIASPYYLGDRT